MASRKLGSKSSRTKSPKKPKRPSIPSAVQLKLWVLSAGRCQFRGCNKPLWRDSVTLQEANYSNIGHIISWTPTGPRGDTVKSPKLAKDFKNLMLVCRDHNKTIDDAKLVATYPVDLLKAFKNEHEERIRTLCDIQESNRTHVLILKGKIGDHAVEIDEAEAYRAILPRYPADEKGIHIDVTGISSDSAEFWTACVAEIRRVVDGKLSGGNDRNKVKHISVFAFAPIPVLIKLGHILGDKIPVDLFQYHRPTQNWMWPVTYEPVHHFTFQCLKDVPAAKDVSLLLSLSGKVEMATIASTMRDGSAVYEITIPAPDPLFIKTKDQIAGFRSIYWKAISEIHAKHGAESEIHLFPAVPLTIAVECGRSILPKVHPKVKIYDADKKHGGFRFIFDLQEPSSAPKS